MSKSGESESKLTPREGLHRSNLEKKCMNCGLTMPYDHDCECLLAIGEEMRARLRMWRERMDLEATDEVDPEFIKKRPARQEAEPDEPKQGGLF